MTLETPAFAPLQRSLSLPLLLTIPLCVYIFISASLQALAMQPAAWTLAQHTPDLPTAMWVLAPLGVLLLLLLLSWLTVVRIVFRRSLMAARIYVSLILAWAATGAVLAWTDSSALWRTVLALWCSGLLALAIALWRER